MLHGESSTYSTNAQISRDKWTTFRDTNTSLTPSTWRILTAKQVVVERERGISGDGRGLSIHAICMPTIPPQHRLPISSECFSLETKRDKAFPRPTLRQLGQHPKNCSPPSYIALATLARLVSFGDWSRASKKHDHIATLVTHVFPSQAPPNPPTLLAGNISHPPAFSPPHFFIAHDNALLPKNGEKICVLHGTQGAGIVDQFQSDDTLRCRNIHYLGLR